MIQPLLTRLDELEKSATKEPWRTPEEIPGGISSQEFYGHDDVIDHEDCRVWPWNKEEDMKFAYALRNAYPLLRAEIERLQEVERKYNELCK